MPLTRRHPGCTLDLGRVQQSRCPFWLELWTCPCECCVLRAPYADISCLRRRMFHQAHEAAAVASAAVLRGLLTGHSEPMPIS